MKKPEKFNAFINAMFKEACRTSLVDVMSYHGIDEEALEDCEYWLGELLKIKELEE